MRAQRVSLPDRFQVACGSEGADDSATSPVRRCSAAAATCPHTTCSAPATRYGCRVRRCDRAPSREFDARRRRSKAGARSRAQSCCVRRSTVLPESHVRWPNRAPMWPRRRSAAAGSSAACAQSRRPAFRRQRGADLPQFVEDEFYALLEGLTASCNRQPRPRQRT